MNANDLKIGKSFPHGDKIEGGKSKNYLLSDLASVVASIDFHYQPTLYRARYLAS